MRRLCNLGLLLFLLVTASCGGGSGSSISIPPTPVTGNKWTVMVYLDGDNNLSTFALTDLEEMVTVGSTENVTVIVQLDTHGGPTLRYKVNKEIATLLEDLGEQDMSSADTLRNFVDFSLSNYAAEHYALILWNHGQGWKSAASGIGTKSIFNDQDNGNGGYYNLLSNHSVALAIHEALDANGVDSLDVLGVDACDMGGIEAAYEFRKVAGIYVASPDLITATGWNYTDLLRRLTSNPTMTPSALASAMVSSFQSYYNGHGIKDHALSAIALQKEYSAGGDADIDGLAIAVNDLAVRLRNLMLDSTTQAATLSLLTNARANVLEFDAGEIPAYPATYIDLVDFARRVDGVNSPVEQAYKKILIKQYHGSARPITSNDLSIVFFNRSSIYDAAVYDSSYRNFDESTDTGSKGEFINNFNWDEMLHTYYGYQYPLKPN